MTTIIIQGDEDVKQLLARLGDGRALKMALYAMGVHYKGKINRYPPATEANQPRAYNTVSGGNTWYERGYGSKRIRRDGSIVGRKTSETLGRKWTVERRDQGLTVVVGNNVSYSIYVHDADKQAWFHARRGWKTAQQVLEDEKSTLLAFAQTELDKLLKSL